MNTHPLHHKAEQSREEGNFEVALDLYDDVIAEYQHKLDFSKVVEALQGKFLTYKHMYLKTNDPTYAEKGRQALEESLLIAKKNGLPTAFCYFHLGEASILLKEYEKAASFYQISLREYKEGPHIGDIRYHLGEALYRNGQKEEGMTSILTGLQEIQQKAGELGSFIKNVWESGAHMRLAEFLMTDNPSEAKVHLLEAKKIIDADPRLILRKKQLEKLFSANKNHVSSI